MEHEDFLTVPETSDEDTRPPLWKQLAGAVIGGGLALALYYAYGYAKPQVVAYLTLPVAEGGRMYDLGASNIADKTMDDSERKRILSRNLRAAGVVQDNTANNELLNTVETHEYDITWPGHDESDPKYAEATKDMNVSPPTDDIAAEYIDKWSQDGDSQDPEMIAQINNALFDEEVATKEMATEDDWESLWGDISDREHDEDMEASNAKALPDTGFGLGFVAVGAVGGAIGARRKKKQI